GTLTLMDEVLTPDSSRFWPADSYEEGNNPPSFENISFEQCEAIIGKELAAQVRDVSIALYSAASSTPPLVGSSLLIPSLSSAWMRTAR
ncbi:phosphoribosylaminoimidazolesuccinocarboxamide synthase, partial [Acinetobacter baumannii]|uniref:phosphoribosylaminoimidazolesuccinocarboxamide synthase n=1 Tax=Acinetobacter baumannii TaxID=470 RepID=UPI002244E6A2